MTLAVSLRSASSLASGVVAAPYSEAVNPIAASTCVLVLPANFDSRLPALSNLLVEVGKLKRVMLRALAQREARAFLFVLIPMSWYPGRTCG